MITPGSWRDWITRGVSYLILQFFHLHLLLSRTETEEGTWNFQIKGSKSQPRIRETWPCDMCTTAANIQSALLNWRQRACLAAGPLLISEKVNHSWGLSDKQALDPFLSRHNVISRLFDGTFFESFYLSVEGLLTLSRVCTPWPDLGW